MKRIVDRIWLIATVLLAVAVSASLVHGHGGHGKVEVQFKIAPTAIVEPSAALIKMGDIQITRGEYFDYIRNVGAFQMKVDLLQRDFLLHYWVIEGVSRYYPSDINEMMPRLMGMGDAEAGEFDKRMADWAKSQAGLLARMMHYAGKARTAGRHKDPKVQIVLGTFAAHIKADFLEDLVSFGSMIPTKAGLEEFVAGLSQQQKQDIESQYPNPNTVKGTKRKAGRKRWIQFRRDLMQNTPYERTFEKVSSIGGPQDRVIAKIGEHKLTIADFMAIYGPVPTDVNWNNIKKSRGSQLMLAFAMADEADRLGIVPQRVKAKIALTETLYLAADQMVREFGPKVVPMSRGEIDFQYFREIALYANLLKFEKTFLTASEKLPVYQDLWIDAEFLKSVKWTVDEAYTPEQPKYF